MKKCFLFVVLLFFIYNSDYIQSQSSKFKVDRIQFKEITTESLSLYYEYLYSKITIVDIYVIDIISLSLERNINPILMLSFLEQENPDHNPLAVHKNVKAGKVLSEDFGLFQINSKWLSFFIESYWKEDRSFDVFNARDNTILAIEIFKSLINKFNDINLAVMAYNAGSGRVIKNKIPESTKRYFYNYKKTIADMLA